MSDHNKEMERITQVLIGSACTWTASKIWHESNRFAYVKAMSRCSTECKGKSVSDMRTILLKLQRDTPRTFVKRFELFSNVKRYYMLGIEMSLEIVESMNTRFEKGYSHADEYFVRNILEGRKNAS